MIFKEGGINSVALTRWTWWGVFLLYIVNMTLVFGVGLWIGTTTACGHREPWTVPTPGGGYQLILPRGFYAVPVIGEFGMPFIDHKRKDAN